MCGKGPRGLNLTRKESFTVLRNFIVCLENEYEPAVLSPVTNSQDHACPSQEQQHRYILTT